MAKPIIQSTGGTSGAGTAGEGRNDLVIGETVNLTDEEAANDGASYAWELVDVPIDSSATLTDPNTATPSFSPDVTGSYKIQCTVDGADADVEILAVPLPTTNARIPAFEEELEYDAGGNEKGWQEAVTSFMREVDSALADTGGGGDADFNPDTDATYDLGDSETPLRWRDAHFAGDITTAEGGKVYLNKEAIPAPDPVTATREAYTGDDIAGSSKWTDIALGSDGKLYCSPWLADAVLIIDPVAETFETNNFGLSMSGFSDRWWGIVEGSDGKLYCPPTEGDDILIIDPSGPSATRSGMGITVNGTYRGIAAGADDKLYCAPNSSSNILVIDPGEGTAVEVNFGNGDISSYSWRGIALADNGKLYCAPHDWALIEIDPSAEEIVVVDPFNDGIEFDSNNGWMGIAKSSVDGKLYCAPWNSDYVLVIDPNDLLGGTEMKDFGLNLNLSGTNEKWGGIAEGPDLKLYCTPNWAEQVLVIDPISGTASLENFGVDFSTGEDGKWLGIAKGADDKLYSSPYNGEDTLVIDAPTVELAGTHFTAAKSGDLEQLSLKVGGRPAFTYTEDEGLQVHNGIKTDALKSATDADALAFEADGSISIKSSASLEDVKSLVGAVSESAPVIRFADDTGSGFRQAPTTAGSGFAAVAENQYYGATSLSDTALAPTGDATFASWVKPNSGEFDGSADIDKVLILRTQGSGDAYGIGFDLSAATGSTVWTIYYTMLDQSLAQWKIHWVIDESNFEDAWNHVAVLYDTSANFEDTKLYINGSDFGAGTVTVAADDDTTPDGSVSAGPIATPDASQHFFLMNTPFVAGANLDGAFDEPFVLDRLISESELGEWLEGMDTSDADLLGAWTFDAEDTTDDSGNGFTLTASGSGASFEEGTGLLGESPYPVVAVIDGEDAMRFSKERVDVLKPLHVDGGAVGSRTAVSSDHTTNGERIVGVTDTSSPWTITISSEDIAVAGKEIIVKDESGAANSNNITVAPVAGTIDGVASVAITTDYGVVRLYSDGANLFTW